MIEWMARFKIGSRIFAGFIIILVLLCVVAFTGWRALTNSVESGDNVDRRSAQMQSVLQIQIQVADLRRTLRIYGFTGDEKAYDQTKANGAKMIEAMKKLGETFRSQERKDASAKMISLAETYMADFEKLKDMRKSREVAETTMRANGTAVLDKLESAQELYTAAKDFETALVASELQVEAALTRLSALNFINAATPQGAEATKKRLAKMKADTEAAIAKAKNPQAVQILKEVLAGVVAYDASFATLEKVASSSETMVGTTLPAIAAEFSALADSITNGLDAANKQANAEDDAANALAMKMLLIASAISLLLGAVFAWAIARGITVPVGSMTDAMTQLAGGDNSVQVPALGNKDEIGDMAKAVQVFKQNAIDKLRMEAEQRAAEEAQRKAEEEQRQREAAIVAEVAEVAKAASTGDLDRRIDLDGKSGFLLNLCEGVNNLVHLTGIALKDVAGVLGAVAQGDLTRRITGDYAGVFGQLKGDVNLTADKLFEVVSNINEASTQITGAASEVAAGSQDLSERSEQQASALEETAASMEELAATVRQNSANAQQANQLAAGAREVAAGGGQVVSDAISAMGRIEDSSQKIEDIVGMIDEIAFQTNLLALNAAVEAARAGDAGKGFAVVAQEVRNLAQRSAQASKEIKTLIAESSQQVRSGADLVKGAGRTLDEILGSVKRVADIVAEIAAASAEQASGIDQVNAAVTQMDEMTQQNAALVEESTAAAHSLEDQARHLSEVMAFFHTGETAAKPAAPAAGKPAAAAKPAAKAQVKAPVKAKAPAKKPAGTSHLAKLHAKAEAGTSATLPAPSAAKVASSDDDWAEF
jgi:methyl-accepting chemotaxis protein